MSEVNRVSGDVEFVLCDLDGVVWLDRRIIDGADRAVAGLRRAGCRVVFVTNNSVPPYAEQVAALGSVGVPSEGDLVTSAQAAATLVNRDSRVLVVGGAGVVEAVRDRGAEAVRPEDVDGTCSGFDAVIVGLDRQFDYRSVRCAAAAVRDGAVFIATNTDPTFPVPGGEIPGAGALVAAVATASGCDPVVAGKPHRPMVDLVAARCGPHFSPERAVVIGDRRSTDGRFAGSVGCRFVLVRSGVDEPAPGEVGEVVPWMVVDDLRDAVEVLTR